MLEQEKDPQICYNCDEEFIVHTSYETEAHVCFCPFCGGDIEGAEDMLAFDESDEATDEDGLDDF